MRRDPAPPDSALLPSPARRRVHAPRAASLLAGALLALGATVLVSCHDDTPTGPSPEDVARGKDIFRFDTFGDEQFWTDTLRMHEVIQQAVTPAVALSVGLQVDADALPQSVKDAIAAGQVDLGST